MSHKKYALIIGNNQHDDPAWPDLKTPELDANAMTEVLQDPRIGGFDRVDLLLNASVPEMRLGIGRLFNPRSHKPDDLLLLYFSGHGELDSNDDLYFVGRETQQAMIFATGLEASYITRLMDNARSRRQVIILDSCYSGAFGKGGSEQAVPTKEIFEGNGEGRYILASSEALQRSWENDASLGEVEASFFTHFLVEGLRTGAADRDNDGRIHVGELYDHIRAGMLKGVRKQTPIQHSFNVEGKLFIANSPISPFQRAREQLTAVIVRAENAAARGEYAEAERLLTDVIRAEPEGLLGLSAKQMLAELLAERNRSVAYNDVKRLLKGSKRAARFAWRTFREQYPNYDPDGVAEQFAKAAPPPKPKPSTSNIVKKPHIPHAEDLLPPPFAWVKIPAGEVTLISEKGWSKNYIPEGGSQVFEVAPFAIAKYPLTNAQFAPFIEAGGYKEKKWWTEAGWEAREQGWAWDSQEGKWKPTGQSWTEPRYWTDKKWNGGRHPVVGVSWYEVVAYCLWLSDKTGQKIMLPTEQQWQYAAQGDKGWEYPWGNEWDCQKCNNSVKPCDSNSTTPVTAYEGKGDSPFGVVDLAGNVWEWCVTEYESGSNSLDGTNVRVLRGGSWLNPISDLFRVSSRHGDDPSNGD